MASVVVESASHLSVWIMGMVAGIYFLQTFSTELKPLVLAFIFVSILEGVVQFFENVFQKAWRLLLLLVWKAYQLVGVIVIKLCCCPSDNRDVKNMLLDMLRNWGDLCSSWDARDAGKYTIFRIAAVSLTLSLVVLLSILAKGAVEEEVSTMIGKLNLYEHQITSIIQFFHDLIPTLPESMPAPIRNETKQVLQEMEHRWDEAVKQLPGMVQNVGLGLLNSVVTTSSATVMDLIFFLLYSAFMLFDPLHINLEDHPEDQPLVAFTQSGLELANGWMVGVGRQLRGNRSRQVRSEESSAPLLAEAPGGDGSTASAPGTSVGLDAPPNPDLEGRRTSLASAASSIREDAPVRLNELQQHIYRIVWSYFLLTVLLNGIFASASLAVLSYLSVDLSVVFAVMFFVLSFIPELGAILSVILPIPFILLTPTKECHVAQADQNSNTTYYQGVDVDCIDDFGARLSNVAAAVVGMMLVKLLVSNVLSAYFMGRSSTLAGGVSGRNTEVRETHGVIVLFAVVFFGKVWGIVGMLISVPVVSIVRLTINLGAERDRLRAKDDYPAVM